jgi:hypothetical protein
MDSWIGELGDLSRRLGRAAMKHAMDTDVLINVWPMDAGAVSDQLVVGSLLRRCIG